MSDREQIEPCEYRYLDSGIHHFVFHESSRAAIDTFITLLTEAYEGVPPDQTQRILFDVQPNDLPLAYLFWAMQRWLSARKTHIPTRLAILIASHTLVPLVDTFLRGLRLSTLRARIFVHANTDEATHWLLQDHN